MPPLTESLQQQCGAAQFQRLQWLGEIAATQGMSAWLVGGSVRDLLLGRPALDLDLTLEGDATAFAAHLQTQMPELQVRLHEAFGTCTVTFADGRAVDITSSRAEHYAAPAMLPQVSPADIHSDLKRRDFSVNAMAICLAPERFGQLLDPYGGQADLVARHLRVLHAQSFIDDPTRILRGLRFEARLGFRFDAQTEALVGQAIQAGVFEALSGVRLWRELADLLDLPRINAWLPRIADWPGLAEALWDFGLDLRTLAGPVEQVSAILAWYRGLPQARSLRQSALLLRLLLRKQEPARVTALLQRYRWSTRECAMLLRDLAILQQNPPLADIDPWARYQLLSPLSLEGLLTLVTLMTNVPQQHIVCDFLTHQYDLALPLNGDDLRRLGIAEGPPVGQWLARLRQAVVMGEVSSRQSAETWIQQACKQSP